MPAYKYEAMDTTGMTIRGTIESNSEDEATDAIRAKGLYAVSVGLDKGEEEPEPESIIKEGPSIFEKSVIYLLLCIVALMIVDIFITLVR